MTALPPVLDACCGSRMFWFDRSDPRAVFMDIRRETHKLKNSGHKNGVQMLEVNPDLIGDFTQLPFEDGTFALVVFDPPHTVRKSASGWCHLKYGVLSDDWRELLARGFSECFRVLRPLGTLVFKWSDVEIPTAEVLKLTPHKPLVGNRCGRKSNTHWMVFLKP